MIDLDETSLAIREIHELAGGRPYEVNLICHMLFRRVQQEKAEMMVLGYSVLEDVRRELENFQDISKRPVLFEAKRLSTRSLEALALLCAVDGRLSFIDVWSTQYVFKAEEHWTAESLERELDFLVGTGIIARMNGGFHERLTFRGDEFDKIYIKYWAREQNVKAPFWLGSIQELTGWYLRSTGKMRALSVLFVESHSSDLLASAEAISDSNIQDPFIGRSFCAFFYQRFVSYRDRPVMPMLRVDIVLASTPLQMWISSPRPEAAETLKSLNNVFAEFSTRSVGTNCSFTSLLIEIQVPDPEHFVSKLTVTKNEVLKRNMASWHASELAKAYRDDDKQSVRFHAKAAISCGEEVDSCRCNGGYFALVEGDLTLAERLLSNPPEPGTPIYSLATYNLAMLRIKQGRIYEVSVLLKASIKQLEADSGPHQCVCLLSPIEEGGILTLQEIKKDLNLLDVARSSLKIVEDLESKSCA